MEKGPQFKVFHGDQGTLFNQQEHQSIQAQRVVPDEARYHRGYTPDRYRAVRDVYGGREKEGRIYGGGQRPGDKDNTDLREPQNEAKERGFLSRRAGNNRVIETLARSTAPIEHLATRPPTIWMKGSDEAKGAGGRYFSEGHGANRGKDKPIIEMYSKKSYEYTSYDDDPVPSQRPAARMERTRYDRTSKERTLLHEMGHHASTVVGNPHAADTGYRAESPRAMGQEEAFADDYQTEHWRPDPRDVRRGTKRDFDNIFSGYDAMGQEPRNPYPPTEQPKEGENPLAQLGRSSAAQRDFAEGYKEKRRFPSKGFKSPEKHWEEEREHGTGALYDHDGVISVHNPEAYGNREYHLKWRVGKNLGRQFND